VDNMTRGQIQQAAARLRQLNTKQGIPDSRWYDTKRGNPTFRRYFWALMLGTSIASAMYELNQLWRALQDAER
jgi:hypothetical protein